MKVWLILLQRAFRSNDVRAIPGLSGDETSRLVVIKIRPRDDRHFHFGGFAAFVPTTTPAAFSIGSIAEVKSDFAPISRITTSHSRPTASATSIYDEAACALSVTSLATASWR